MPRNTARTNALRAHRPSPAWARVRETRPLCPTTAPAQSPDVRAERRSYKWSPHLPHEAAPATTQREHGERCISAQSRCEPPFPLPHPAPPRSARTAACKNRHVSNSPVRAREDYRPRISPAGGSLRRESGTAAKACRTRPCAFRRSAVLRERCRGNSDRSHPSQCCRDAIRPAHRPAHECCPSRKRHTYPACGAPRGRRVDAEDGRCP